MEPNTQKGFLSKLTKQATDRLSRISGDSNTPGNKILENLEQLTHDEKVLQILLDFISNFSKKEHIGLSKSYDPTEIIQTATLLLLDCDDANVFVHEHPFLSKDVVYPTPEILAYLFIMTHHKYGKIELDCKTAGYKSVVETLEKYYFGSIVSEYEKMKDEILLSGRGEFGWIDENEVYYKIALFLSGINKNTLHNFVNLSFFIEKNDFLLKDFADKQQRANYFRDILFIYKNKDIRISPKKVEFLLRQINNYYLGISLAAPTQMIQSVAQFLDDKLNKESQNEIMDGSINYPYGNISYIYSFASIDKMPEECLSDWEKMKKDIEVLNRYLKANPILSFAKQDMIIRSLATYFNILDKMNISLGIDAQKMYSNILSVYLFTINTEQRNVLPQNAIDENFKIEHILEKDGIKIFLGYIDFSIYSCSIYKNDDYRINFTANDFYMFLTVLLKESETTAREYTEEDIVSAHKAISFNDEKIEITSRDGDCFIFNKEETKVLIDLSIEFLKTVEFLQFIEIYKANRGILL